MQSTFRRDRVACSLFGSAWRELLLRFVLVNCHLLSEVSKNGGTRNLKMPCMAPCESQASKLQRTNCRNYATNCASDHEWPGDGLVRFHIKSVPAVPRHTWYCDVRWTCGMVDLVTAQERRERERERFGDGLVIGVCSVLLWTDFRGMALEYAGVFDLDVRTE